MLKSKLKKMDNEIKSLRKRLSKSNENGDISENGEQANGEAVNLSEDSEMLAKNNQQSGGGDNQQTNGDSLDDLQLEDKDFRIEDLDIKDFDILRVKNEEIEQMKKDYEQQIEAIGLKVSVLVLRREITLNKSFFNYFSIIFQFDIDNMS
jgi:hypothetical protein